MSRSKAALSEGGADDLRSELGEDHEEDPDYQQYTLNREMLTAADDDNIFGETTNAVIDAISSKPASVIVKLEWEFGFRFGYVEGSDMLFKREQAK